MVILDPFTVTIPLNNVRINQGEEEEPKTLTDFWEKE
jgi:hypothetical protein